MTYLLFYSTSLLIHDTWLYSLEAGVLWIKGKLSSLRISTIRVSIWPYIHLIILQMAGVFTPPVFLPCSMWLRKLLSKHIICSNLFYSEGKIIYPLELFFFLLLLFFVWFFFNQSYLEVAPLKNGRQTFIQRDLDRLEKQADRNLIKLFKDKFEAQSLGKNKSKHTEGCLAGKELGRKGSGGPGGHHAEQCALAAKKAIGILGCIRQSIARWCERADHFPLLSTAEATAAVLGLFWAPQY